MLNCAKMLLMKVSFISHIINIKMQFGIMKANLYARLTVKVIHITAHE